MFSNGNKGLILTAIGTFILSVFANGIVAGYLYGGLEERVDNNSSSIVRTRVAVKDNRVAIKATEDSRFDIIERLTKIEVVLYDLKDTFERQRTEASEEDEKEAPG